LAENGIIGVRVKFSFLTIHQGRCMARLKRFCPVGIAQHVIQRGNNRQVCFNGDEDFAAYAHWLKEFAEKYEVEIHAWVFMTNHVHLLMTPQKDNGISQMMQALGRQYVRFYNYTYKRSGTLWDRFLLLQNRHTLHPCK
jgi:putative transposase